MSLFIGEEYFTHDTQNKNHGSQLNLEFFICTSSRQRKLSEVHRMNFIEEDNFSHDFNSMDVSSHSAYQCNYWPSFEYPQSYTQYGDSSISGNSYGYGSYMGPRCIFDQHTSHTYPQPLSYVASMVDYNYV